MPSIMSTRFQGKASCDEVYEMLGLRRTQHLPVEGMPPRLIQDMLVMVRPQRPLQLGERKRSSHRVIAQCVCHRWIPVGRLHQHRCKA